MRSRLSQRNSGPWIGLIILVIGVFLFIDKLDILYFPGWLFSWKVLLIVIGVLIGVRTNFKSIGWLVLVLLGSFFLLDEIPGFEYIRRYSLPIGIIIVGLFIIVRSAARKSFQIDGDGESRSNSNTTHDTEIFGSHKDGKGGGTAEDYIDLTTVFGGINRRVFSKTFKGGKTTNFFGGTDIDLTQADIEGTAVLDCVLAFGGLKLIVPANWEIQSDIITILGGVEDKRHSPDVMGSGKKLILTGSCIFGGVEIKSY